MALCDVMNCTIFLLTILSWTLHNTFFESYYSKHLINNPLWCFLNKTPCMKLYDNALFVSSLFFHIEK